jgi:catechol 2,3-dioxygenase-like lactoylglutathione lyase family enzyme
MNILFVAGFAPIVRDLDAARGLYGKTLGIALDGDDYPSTSDLDGVKHFGLWPLSEAARSCFGGAEWPDGVPVPNAAIEFEVDDVDGAAAELGAAGHELLRPPGDEPWGQRTARLLSADGLLVGVVHTPWLHGTS